MIPETTTTYHPTELELEYSSLVNSYKVEHLFYLKLLYSRFKYEYYGCSFMKKAKAPYRI